MHGIGREIAAGERVEAELDAFVSKRHQRRVSGEGERAVEELWQVSERLHDADRRAENRAAWMAFHIGQVERLRRNLEDLINRHEAEAVRLQTTDERKTA